MSIFDSFYFFKKFFKHGWKKRERGKKNKGYYVVYLDYSDRRIAPYIQVIRMPLFFRFFKRRKIIRDLYENYSTFTELIWSQDSYENENPIYDFGLGCIRFKIDMDLFRELRVIK